MNKQNSSKKPSDLVYLLSYLKPYLLPVIVTILAIIIGQIALTIEPLYLKKIIDYITSHVGISYVGSGEVVTLLIYYFSFRSASFLFDFVRDYFFAPVEMGVGKHVAEDLFDRLVSLPISYHYNQKTGTLARRISRGAQSINFILDFLVINILPTFFDLIFVSILLLKLYPAVFGIITFATVAAYALFTVLATELRQKYRLGANMAEDEASGVQIETIYNIDTVKYFGNEQYQRRKFSDRIQEWYERSVKSNRLFGAISAGQSIILLIGFGLIVYLSIKQALIGTLTVGDLVLLTTYVVRLSTPISTLGFVYRRIKDGLTDIGDTIKIMRTEVELPERPNTKTIPSPVGELNFNKVQFNYGNRKALSGLTFKIQAGKRVAIVGPSGAGKSTIVKLLFRLYDPESGQILIDGHDIRDIRYDQRHEIVALVPQESALFNDTIEQNIRFGKPDASRAEVEQSIKLANLDDLIKRLPEGLATIVGERGVKISGGEKQRVAIARAIIKDPKILVFDEATSNLDSESEREILKSINDVSAGRTTISIAHRLPTIINSDTIFVIDDGKLAEQGTHTELLKKNGIYAKLWQNFI